MRPPDFERLHRLDAVNMIIDGLNILAKELDDSAAPAPVNAPETPAPAQVDINPQVEESSPETPKIINNAVNLETDTIQALSLAAYLERYPNHVTLYVMNFVDMVLAYLRRRDFPRELVGLTLERLRKQLDAQRAAEADEGAPIRRITQDDVTFEFAVDSGYNVLRLFGSELFQSLKGDLNLWRKIKCL